MKITLNKIVNTLFTVLVLGFFTTSIFASGNDDKAEVEKKDIVTIAVEAGNFKTLAAALTAAGLIETLQGEGPFTVFAPTDEAFAKLPKGTVENLLEDKEALTSILLYHVVSGNVTSDQVVKLDAAKTLNESEVKVKVSYGKVFINSSEVTTADIHASNGVIHIIDTVLIPETE